MTRFNVHELRLMMLYNPGTRVGLIAELSKMQQSLTGRDRNLRKWTASALEKLNRISDGEFEELRLYPDFGEEDLNDE